jgi:hypothetical protein
MRKPQLLILSVLLALLSLPGLGSNQAGLAGAVQAKEDQCDLKNAVLVGSTYGIACADDSGWNTYKSNGILKTSGASDLAVCPDGTLAFASAGSGVSFFDGKKTSTLVKPPSLTGSKLACGGPDNVWVAGLSDTLMHFDGKKWETIKLKEQFKNDTAVYINDIALSPDGKTVWVVTLSSLGLYDGKEWTVFDKENGLKGIFSITGGVVFDSKGNAWVGSSGGVLQFDGKAFKEFKQANVYAKALAVDSKDVLWVGTLSDGVYSFDGKKWTGYNRKTKSLPSNRVNAIDVDDEDRVWVGTAWGVSVLDGKDWTVFQAANSDLAENNATSILALGKGPKTLPEPVAKKPGKVIGKIIQGRDPVKKGVIELCSEGAPIGSFRGKTPCGDYPDALSATTDENGEFEIEDVPVGRYGFVVQGGDKKWYSFFSGSAVVVTEGKTVDLETISLKSS